jgi:hypothetical protein
MKLIEGLFHANAVMLLAIAYIAYNTEGAMLIAALLFSMAILTEGCLIFFKDDADPASGIDLKIRKIKRKVERIQAKKEKEKREQYLCRKCQASTPVMS